MADGDPVSQKEFYKESSASERRILKAIGKVDRNVSANNTKLGVVETKLNANEKRMDGQDVKIDDQKKWNRGLAAVEGLIATGLAYLGIRGD